MRTITLEVFKYNELSESAKAVAIKDWYEGLEFDPWLQQYEDELELMGFTNPYIQYSGFCSQGGGASFTAGIDLSKFLTGKFEPLKELDFTAKVFRKSSYYVHEQTCAIELVFDHEGAIEQNILIEELYSHLEIIRLEQCNKIYRFLEDDYYYQTSDKIIEETLIENNYEFYITGKMI